MSNFVRVTANRGIDSEYSIFGNSLEDCLKQFVESDLKNHKIYKLKRVATFADKNNKFVAIQNESIYDTSLQIFKDQYADQVEFNKQHNIKESHKFITRESEITEDLLLKWCNIKTDNTYQDIIGEYNWWKIFSYCNGRFFSIEINPTYEMDHIDNVRIKPGITIVRKSLS